MPINPSGRASWKAPSGGKYRAARRLAVEEESNYPRAAAINGGIATLAPSFRLWGASPSRSRYRSAKLMGLQAILGMADCVFCLHTLD
jgi:hypothetical protein